MSTSNVHFLQKIYRREIQEAFELLGSLEKDGLFNVPKINWWILKYEELNEYSWNHRHTGSCIEGMGCSCSSNSPESKLSSLYSDLREVVVLHNYEKYFEEQLSVFRYVKDDYPALMQWLKKNEILGSEKFLLFWLEWYVEDSNLVIPFIPEWKNNDFKFKAEEWKNSIKFCKLFNELYWTSGLCEDD